jgi:hypothetical protein
MHDTEGETIDDVRRQRDELGIQLAALRERLRLAMAVVDKFRFRRTCRCGHIACNRCRDDRFAADALAALDAVPGDTLERP